MPLAAPNLDDRRFQNLVDDAKRLVQRRCPEWTDHNVSDPGVTLIEAVSYVVDQLIYRLNRVPDLHYLKFLDLIGVRLYPPTAAKVPVTFWMSAPRDSTLVVRSGSVVATRRGDAPDSAVAFSTSEQLDIVHCEVSYVCSIPASGSWRNHTDEVKLSPFSCFSSEPQPGEALLVGLSAAVPRCVVNVRFDCEIEGVGVDPDDPPLIWEAYDGESWVECEVDRDTTGGLNRAGDVQVHVPASHRMALEHNLRAGWLRARVTVPEEDQPFYSHSPLIRKVGAFTIGGTIEALQAEAVDDEVLGLSDGTPGQRFAVSRPPITSSSDPVVLQVSGEAGWQDWSEVESFAHSGREDRHFMIDRSFGEVVLGPALRLADGGFEQHGAVPEKGSVLKLARYYCGGGRHGNVATGAISVCRTSIPYISRVENRHPASGGTDGESVEEAKVRGPIALRTLGRAVTAEDYEQLAREAAPEAARIKAVPASGPEEAGGVRVLVVPAVSGDESGQLHFEQLVPPSDMLAAVASHLDGLRTIGARVLVEPPAYQGVTVVAELRARTWSDPAQLRSAAISALYHFLHPITGGPNGTGWPFGRPVHVGDIYAVLQGLVGTELVEDVRLFAANALTGERGQAAQRVNVAPNALVFSYEHQVRVEGMD